MPETDLVDDKSIPDENPLWRRIHPEHWVPGGQGNFRLSSAAFQDHPNGSPMSVFIVGAESSVEAALRGYRGFGLAEFSAGLARRLDQGIHRAPLPDQPDHGEVFGKKTHSVKKAFASNAALVQPPMPGD